MNSAIKVHEPFVELIRQCEPALRFPWSSRPMFGGAMVYADGKPIASLSNAGFAIKLPPDLQTELLSIDGAERLQHGPEQAASRSYIVLPPSVLDDPARLASWLNSAFRSLGA